MSTPLKMPELERLFRVKPGARVSLKNRDPGWLGTPAMRQHGKDEIEDRSRNHLKDTVRRLAEAQEVLWASDTWSVLVVLQAMDAAGKDGTIKHVMSGLNPQGCSVVSFKQPSAEELDHTFLWRQMKAAPERGKIVVFNRSQYEDVLVTRVHPELLDAAKLPPTLRGRSFWRDRFDDINAFERHLTRNGTLVLKFFLHLSKEEQRRRFIDRLTEKDKRWKFSAKDANERMHWRAYQNAYEDAMSATSTPWAPWWIIPADHKFVTRSLVATIIAESISKLRLSYPTVSTAERKAQRASLRRLQDE